VKRLVYAGCLLAFAGAGVGSTIVATAAPRADHVICVVFAQDPNGNKTEDLCVNYPNRPVHP
jgi:hypothetical protein